MSVWTLYFVWLAVLLTGFCWFGVLKPVMRWGLMDKREHVFVIVFALASLILVLGFEVLPISSFANSDSSHLIRNWIGCSIVLTVFVLFYLGLLADITVSPLINADPEKGIVGWLVSFGRIQNYKGPASRVNSFWLRYFSLWWFKSGHDVHDFEAEMPDRALTARLTIKAREETTPQGFDRAIVEIPAAFQDLLETLLEESVKNPDRELTCISFDMERFQPDCQTETEVLLDISRIHFSRTVTSCVKGIHLDPTA